MRRFDVDVVHVSDERLDILLGTRDRSDGRRLLATIAFTWALRLRRIALVRTLSPSPGQATSRAGRSAQRILDDATDLFVAFDAATKTPAPERTAVVPHAHFRERFVGYPRSPLVSGRVAWALTAGPEEAPSRSSTPCPRDTEPLVISSETSDGALVLAITAAELVVLPAITTLSDLQLLFLALSLDRAVLTCRTDAMISLAELVGPGWLILAEDRHLTETIGGAIEQTRSASRTSRPLLDGRDRVSVMVAYSKAYGKAAESRRGRSKARRA